jgi:hypothetical protein
VDGRDIGRKGRHGARFECTLADNIHIDVVDDEDTQSGGEASESGRTRLIDLRQ